MDSTEQLQPVIQLLPEEYQGLAVTCIALATAGILLYTLFIAPIMNKMGMNKQTQAIADNSLTEAQIATMLDEKLAVIQKEADKKELIELKVRLAFASEDNKPMMLQRIAELESRLNV
jgi:hypothetical protein